MRNLKDISRTSVMEYRGKAPNVREIGQRLDVGTILEGSIRRGGNTLRLTVQQIDARDDRHLFAANYDSDLAHLARGLYATYVAADLDLALTELEAVVQSRPNSAVALHS